MPRERRLQGDLLKPGPRRCTIARSRVRHQEALADLFGQALGLCAETGLVEVAVLAVDGSKFEASASDHRVMRAGRRFGGAPKPYAPPATPGGLDQPDRPDSNGPHPDWMMSATRHTP
ncbi:hypothetical protein [Streptomyces davaonensis]|uniref:hypothetical protein n=1 Tax=Streptomyces davaonensis TaxID=348043 RepID=UPI00034CEB0B|nr:hypothetical protein [Streptomyces davaonensis]